MADDDSKEPPLPPGWTKGFSKSNKRTYYAHAETKHTQWYFPTASEVADPKKAKQRAEQNMKKQQHSSHGGDRKPSAAAASSKRRPDEEHRRKGGSEGTPSSLNSFGSKRPRNDSAARNGVDPLADATCVAIIVPYRDLHPEQNRARHLSQFVPHMHRFLQKQLARGAIRDYHIYIIEQSDDKRKFNRGKLLNIGFDIARRGKFRALDRGSKPPAPIDVFCFHDVDLLPADDLGPYYTRFPKIPIHIARVWKRYSNNPKYFGGIVSFSNSDMKRINGYPNTFWGWGGEDDEMQKRLERLGIKWDYPSKGTIEDLEHMSLDEKLEFLRTNKTWKCMVKWEALGEHEATWRTNGLNDLSYTILETTDLDMGQWKEGDKSRATRVSVDVKLNGNHWANDKCGVDYMGY